MNIVFLYFIATGVSAASLLSRFVSPSCFLNDVHFRYDVHSTMESSFENIQAQVLQLRNMVKNRITQMELCYCIDIENEDLNTDMTLNSSADNGTFLDDYIYNKTSLLDTVSGHYEMLNRLAYELELLSQTAADTYARRKLLVIQGLVYDVMCTIKTLLRSQNENPTSHVPSGGNIFYHDGICDQHESEYKTMLNAHSIADYLNALYSTVLNYQN